MLPEKARYFVVDPVPDGEEYYFVNDSENERYPNFSMATFFEKMPNARKEAYGLCSRLNGENKAKEIRK